MAAPIYNVYVGAETGLLKGVDTINRSLKNLNEVKTLSRDQEISLLCWGNNEETEICVGLKNQTVRIFDTVVEDFTDTINVSGGEGRLTGLCKYNGHLLTCVESGHINLWTTKLDKKLEINAGENICRMRQNCNKPNLFATGGKENDLKIWDLLAPEKPVFTAKNVRNDFLDLRVPIWVQDMQFFNDSDKIVVCTGHHQIRVYDPNTSQRRPVMDMELGEHPLMALSLVPNKQELIVGNSRGYMHLVDLRKASMVHRYKGFAGSIRCISCHPVLPIVASCGLDRFLRIHDINTHTLLNKIYLKSRLNTLLLRTEFEHLAEKQKAEDKNKPSEMTLEDDELWNNMDIVSETSTKKPKKRKKIQETKKKLKKISQDP